MTDTTHSRDHLEAQAARGWLLPPPGEGGCDDVGGGVTAEGKQRDAGHNESEELRSRGRGKRGAWCSRGDVTRRSSRRAARSSAAILSLSRRVRAAGEL